MKCPQCKAKMEKVQYNIGFGIVVDSLTCPNCRYNFTKEADMDKAIRQLQKKVSVEVKVIRIGSGIGIRVPNKIAKQIGLKYGQKIKLSQQGKQIIIRK